MKYALQRNPDWEPVRCRVGASNFWIETYETLGQWHAVLTIDEDREVIRASGKSERGALADTVRQLQQIMKEIDSL